MEFNEGLNLTHYKLFKVLSSKCNEVYEIILHNNHWKCNCTGFKFKKHCKHIRTIQIIIKEQYSSYLEHENRITIDEIVSSTDFQYIKMIIK